MATSGLVTLAVHQKHVTRGDVDVSAANNNGGQQGQGSDLRMLTGSPD